MSDKQSEKEPSIFHSLKAVLWAMLGVRQQRGYDEDVAKVKPSHAIIIGLIAVILFILVLASVVKFVIGSAAG
jgi:hypothetical protein